MWRARHWLTDCGDTLAKVKTMTLGNQVGDLESEALHYTLPDRLTKVKAQTVSEKLRDV